jgi:uncharacterized cupin superfamily protein
MEKTAVFAPMPSASVSVAAAAKPRAGTPSRFSPWLFARWVWWHALSRRRCALLSGRLVLRAGDNQHELAEGNSIYFDSGVPHGYRNAGPKLTSALVVTLEPRK